MTKEDEHDALPRGPLDMLAISLHESYNSFLRAGFSEEKSFSLTRDHWVSILSAQLLDGHNPDDDH